VRPTVDIPVGLFCDTYEKARIAKAGNFDVPVGEVKFEEKVRGVRNGSNATPVMVLSPDRVRRTSDNITRKSYQ
jgi:hypothetical protein